MPGCLNQYFGFGYLSFAAVLSRTIHLGEALYILGKYVQADSGTEQIFGVAVGGIVIQKCEDHRANVTATMCRALAAHG